MRRKNFLALLVIGLMLCSILSMQAGVIPAQAATSNLPGLTGQAVTYLQAQYQANGAQDGLDVHYPYVLYVLESAGVNTNGWIYEGKTMPDAVTNMVYADVYNTTVPVKYLASDLLAMKAMGNTGYEDQLLNLLTSRQNSDGSFHNDSNLYSIIPAYDLLGRAGELSVINAVYAENYILGQQSSNADATYGSFGSSYQGTFYPDFMSTAEAVRALNYLEGAASNSAIAPAIAKGTSWMQEQQKSGGMFQAALDDPIIDTVEAIATQKALGIDPASASGWNISGETAVDYLNTCTLDTADTTGAYDMDATWILDGCNLLGIPVSLTQSVSAVNGTVTVNLSAAPATTPVIGDFVVTQSINGAATATITPSAISTSGTTVTLTVPQVAATASSQSVVISVSYLGGTAIAASAFIVPGTSNSVRVRVEGPTSNLADTTVSVSGSALDALDAAVGNSNVSAPGGFISTIDNISGNFSGSPPTSWFYYCVRNGAIDPASLNSGAGSYTVENGDQVIFYIGAYDATTYADLTYLPVVTVSPQSPMAGQTVTISVYAEAIVSNPTTYISSLEALTDTEAAAIGNYTVTVGGVNYTTSNGQATIPGSAVTAGTLTYAVTNYNSAGYPNVVRYAGSISVASASTGSGGVATISVGVWVVGMNGQTMYGPSYVIVNPDNQWGLTVLGALDATDIHYATTNTDYGVWVINIDGEAMQQGGTTGWIYTVNGVEGSVGPAVATVKNNDQVIWYWSNSMSQQAPTWPASPGGGSTGVTSTTGSASVDPATGGTVSLGSGASVNIPAGALNGTASATVTVQQVNSPPAVPSGFSLLGSVYEFTVGGQTSYQFASDVTLTFDFNPTDVPAGETPSVYYYDETTGQWVSIGGTVSGSTITVTVNHFTEFAVMAAPAAQTPATTVTAPAVPTSFSDVSVSCWAYNAIESLSGLGCVSGYPDGSFRPNASVTRAEFVSILDKALKLAPYNPTVPDFGDVTQGDWFYGPVESAVHAGIIKGFGGDFKPNTPITREQMATILVNALNEQDQARAIMSVKTTFTDDAGISAWARGFVEQAVRDGLLKGYPDNSFVPQGDATRAEACAMIENFLSMHK